MLQAEVQIETIDVTDYPSHRLLFPVISELPKFLLRLSNKYLDFVDTQSAEPYILVSNPASDSIAGPTPPSRWRLCFCPYSLGLSCLQARLCWLGPRQQIG